MRTLLRGAVFVLIVLLCKGSIAQSSHQIFEHLTTDHGLSSNKAGAILQDKEGFYWIATQNGLNRFDGTQFKVFRHDKTDSTSLTHNYCTALAEGKDGDIWVATYKGISRYKKDKGYFQQMYIDHPSENFEITNRIYNLVSDTSGNIWVAANGLWKYDLRQDRIIFFQPEGKLQSRYYQINHLVFDPGRNGLWFTSADGLFFFSIADQEFYHQGNNPAGWKVFDHADYFELCLDKKNRLWFRDRKEQVLSFYSGDLNHVTLTSKKINHGIKKIGADEKNRIWIFYWLVGAEIFDPETEMTDSEFFMPYHRRSAISRQGNYLYVDQQNNHWISSDKGISIYNQANQYYRLHQFIPEETTGKEPVRITALAQNKPGSLWVGTNLGLYSYDLQHGTTRHISVMPLSSMINALCADGDQLWIGTYDRLLCLDTQKEILTRNIQLQPGIFFIRKGSYDDLWVGLWTNGLYRMNVLSGSMTRFTRDSTNATTLKSNNLITGFHHDDSFWIGYNGGTGFSAQSGDSDSWVHFHPQEDDLSSAHAGTITVITGVSSDMIWLGTYGGGIFRYDLISRQYENYEQIQGLNSNFINSIIPDAEGGLWISTADGMNYMNTVKKTIRSLDIGLVFPNNVFVANGIAGVIGKLYFFCQDELVEIDPALFTSGYPFPQMVISSFKVFDQEMALSNLQQEINLTYKQNFFSFDFSSIRTHPGKEVQYAYRLVGFDKAWNISGPHPFASYTNVPDGDFLFEVKATNEEGLWSEPLIRIPVHITPPFWRTWWFILLSIGILLLGIYALYHYRVQQIRKIFSVRTKISRDLHDDIGASLSSIHFNSSVAEKEVSGNPEKASEILRQINQNSRQVIENISDIVWANTDQREKSSLAGRIKNYGYDLLSQKNIECSYVIDDQAERKLSNPEARRNVLLIIKEAMNNIAKYSEAEFAEVHVGLIGSHLHVDISDNGRGFNVPSGNKGNGLMNMKKRTDSLGGTFHVHSIPGKGTEIHCRIPIPNISDI